MEWRYGCNTTAATLKEKEIAGQEITMAGLVTGLQERISKKGSPWGLLTIQDYTGSAEIRLFGDTYLKYKSICVTGVPIFIKASYQQGRFKPELLDFNIHQITLLENLQGTVVKSLTLNLDTKFNDSNLFEELSKYVTDEDNKASTVYIEFTDSSTTQRIKVRLNKKININQNFVKMLDAKEIEYQINQG